MTPLSALASCLVLVGSADPAPNNPPRSAWHVDPAGRRFRVAFDPGNRLVLGAGWSAHWNNFWGWIYRNDAGAVRFDDPATELDGQRGGRRTSGASGESAAAADGGDRPRFQPPASGHGVPAVDDPMAVGDL